MTGNYMTVLDLTFDPWLRQKLRISVLIKTGPATKLLSWRQHNSTTGVILFLL